MIGSRHEGEDMDVGFALYVGFVFVTVFTLVLGTCALVWGVED